MFRLPLTDCKLSRGQTTAPPTSSDTEPPPAPNFPGAQVPECARAARHTQIARLESYSSQLLG